ncbi:MAG: MFS transporter [Variovorax sp.]|nr:MAG: MFS transporter [Variovorax sp.]
MKALHGRALLIFGVFAAGYFLSSLVRGVTATLAPVLKAEFSLTAGELGLLGGAYFLGFAVLQLPLGNWLDRFGPKRVLLTCLVGAVLSCAAFAMATGFTSLLVARWIGGIGVSACLIAPLTGARLWLDPRSQQSANSWMLMAGSLGLLMATQPVQWVLPSHGWRIVFWVLAALFGLTMLGTAWWVPGAPAAATTTTPPSLMQSYRPVFESPYFRRIAGIEFLNYGVLVALQTLWAGPWMTDVTGQSAAGAARGLFIVNLTMLFVFWGWGMVNPRLHQVGLSAERIMVWGLPLNFLSLAAIAWLGQGAGWQAFAVYCALSSVLALTHPAVGAAFPAHLAGRAISAFNLLLFLGVFFTQWGIGASLDALKAAHWATPQAYRLVFGILALGCALSYGWFCLGMTRNRSLAATA